MLWYSTPLTSYGDRNTQLFDHRFTNIALDNLSSGAYEDSFAVFGIQDGQLCLFEGGRINIKEKPAA